MLPVDQFDLSSAANFNPALHSSASNDIKMANAISIVETSNLISTAVAIALVPNNGFVGTYHMPLNATQGMPVALAPQPSPALANAITYLQQIDNANPRSPNPVAVTSNADNPYSELVRQIVSNCSPEDLAAALDAEVKKQCM